MVKAAVYVFLLAFGSGVCAATVHLGPDGHVQSITDLMVGGTSYDATFHKGSGVTFNSLWDNDGDKSFDDNDGSLFNHAPVFMGNDQLAKEATNQIMAVLGASYTTSRTYTDLDYFYVPYSYDPGGIWARFDSYGAKLDVDILGLLQVNPTLTYVVPYVSFQVSSVPIPAALWLFSSALAGFGFIGRKKT